VVSILRSCGEATVIGMPERAFNAPTNVDHAPSEKFLAQQDPNGRQRTARSAVEGGRRARRNITRYCVANRLQFMWTLTFAVAEWDVDTARDAVSALMSKLAGWFGQPFPYLYVFELHPGTDENPEGHGLHVHLGVPIFIDHGVMTELWGQGHTWVRGPKRRGMAAAVSARSTARYVAKYVDKAVDEEHDFGRHRYEVAQGFTPQAERIRRWNLADGIRYAIEQFGQQPSYVWRSDEDPTWLGPPCCKMWFDPVAPDD
jgi:hypothetical protein